MLNKIIQFVNFNLRPSFLDTLYELNSADSMYFEVLEEPCSRSPLPDTLLLKGHRKTETELTNLATICYDLQSKPLLASPPSHLKQGCRKAISVISRILDNWPQVRQFKVERTTKCCPKGPACKIVRQYV